MTLGILISFILGVLVGLKWGCESVAQILYDSAFIDYDEYQYMKSWKYFFEIFCKK